MRLHGKTVVVDRKGPTPTTGRLALMTADGKQVTDLTTYDAAYVELAMRCGLPLATLDARLTAVAAAAGVSLYNPPAPPAEES